MTVSLNDMRSGTRHFYKDDGVLGPSKAAPEVFLKITVTTGEASALFWVNCVNGVCVVGGNFFGPYS